MSWRNYLTETEGSILKYNEAVAKRLDERRQKITAEMNVIRNRATQRRRYAQSQYLRCISDGGTQERCVEKYLLPEKEPKP